MYLLIIIFVIILSLGFHFHKSSFYPKTSSYERIISSEIEKGTLTSEWINSLEFEKVEVESRYGYKLNGRYIDNNSDTTVVVCHGYTSNIMWSLKYAKIFLELGYNTLVYDNRYHGKSEGTSCTFGYYEKDDLDTIVNWLRTIKQPKSIGLHGESMGAATVLLYGAVDRNISFIVADCPFADLYEQMAYRLKGKHRLPAFPILNAGSLISKLISGFYFEQVSPIKVVKDIQASVLFIHGDADTFILKEHSQRLYDTVESEKQILFIEGAEHTLSLNTNQQRYKETIKNFLEYRANKKLE